MLWCVWVVIVTVQEVCKTVMWDPVNEESLLHVKKSKC